MTSVSPGSTATSMPTTSPTTRAVRLMGWNTVRKPAANCCATSSTAISLANAHQPHQQERHLRKRLLAQRQRHVHDLHEDKHENEAAQEAAREHDAQPPIATDPRETGKVEESAK